MVLFSCVLRIVGGVVVAGWRCMLCCPLYLLSAGVCCYGLLDVWLSGDCCCLCVLLLVVRCSSLFVVRGRPLFAR